MKSIFAALLVAAAGVAASAQQPEAPASKVVEPMAVCDLSVENSPIVNSLKLRMPEPEAALKLGAAFEKDSSDARRKIVNTSVGKIPIFEAENISNAALTSVDGKVDSIRLTYSTPWTSAKEYVNKFAPKLGLVRIAFRLDDDKREARISCKNFAVELKAAGSGSELLITETTPAAKPAGE